MIRSVINGFGALARRAAAAMALAAGLVLATPALAVDHTQVVPRGHEGHAPAHPPAHRDHDRDRGHERREFRRGPSVGLFFGAPAYVPPPPVYYAPAYPYGYGTYPYAPAPISGVYLSPYGYYCRDYRTTIGIETACLQPDGVWRFIN